MCLLCRIIPLFIPRLHIGSQITFQESASWSVWYFLKQEAGNYSAGNASDGAVLVRRHGASPEQVRCIEPGNNLHVTFNIFEAQFIHEYNADGGFVLDKWNPWHIMIDTYSHSHEVDEVAIGSVHSDEFTCT